MNGPRAYRAALSLPDCLDPEVYVSKLAPAEVDRDAEVLEP